MFHEISHPALFGYLNDYDNPHVAVRNDHDWGCPFQSQSKLFGNVGKSSTVTYPPVVKHGWLEDTLFTGDSPIETTIHRGFKIATFEYRSQCDRSTGMTTPLPVCGKMVEGMQFYVTIVMEDPYPKVWGRALLGPWLSSAHVRPQQLFGGSMDL